MSHLMGSRRERVPAGALSDRNRYGLLRLALANALLLLWAPSVVGCVVLQEPIFLEPLPNRPPRILEEGAQPERRIVVPQLPGCSVTFSVPVEDPDTEDNLTARWYIDYDRENNPTPFREFPSLPNGGRALRESPATLTIPLDSITSPLTLGEHIVEALVSDGEVINRIPQPRPPTGTLPDGGRIAQQTYAVSYGWFVEVTDQGTACP